MPFKQVASPPSLPLRHSDLNKEKETCMPTILGLLTQLKDKRPKTQTTMPSTERLYYADSHLAEFEARVVDVSERVSGWTAITLDRTAFYPTGGGQPSDTGTLNGIRVVECVDT